MGTGLVITFVNRTISGHTSIVYGQSLVCAVAMSGHTRDREEPSSSSGLPSKKSAVSRKTIEKWVAENDRDLNTSVWLKFEGDCNHVYSLKCAVCSQFKEKLISMRNYRPAFTYEQRHSRSTQPQTCTPILWYYSRNSMLEISLSTRLSRQPYFICEQWTRQLKHE